MSAVSQIAIVLAALATGQGGGQGEIKAPPAPPPPAAKTNGDPKSEAEAQLSGFSITETVVCIVAVGAFVLAMGNAWAERTHRRLSVKPLMENGHLRCQFSPHFSVRFTNVGLGPAVVKRCRVVWGTELIPFGNDGALHLAIMATMEAFLIRVKYGKPHIKTSWLSEGAGLRPGEPVTILSFENEQCELSNGEAKELEGLFSNLRIHMECRSMYGERVEDSIFNDFERSEQWDAIGDDTK